VLSPNSHKAVPLHPLSGGYVDAVGSGSYPAGVMSPNGALPMNSALEPAMMNLYNNTVQIPIAGSWTYAPGLTTGVYSAAFVASGGMLPAATVTVDPREWYSSSRTSTITLRMRIKMRARCGIRLRRHRHRWICVGLAN
jgi:hypothetical protein